MYLMPNKLRCACDGCKKKLTLIDRTMPCKCGLLFCVHHRLPEAHACTYDYKKDKVVVTGTTVEKVAPI